MIEKHEFFEGTDNSESEALRSRKKLVILFVLQIIKGNTNCNKAFSTADIINRLDRYPYSITVERKAVSKMILTLEEEYPYIIKNEDGRVWYDRDRDIKAA